MGLFSIFIGFLILFKSPASFGLKILGVLVFWIIGLIISFGGYAAIRMSRGTWPKPKKL